MLHTESDTNQRNVTFIDLAGIFRDLKAVLTFFMAAVLSFQNLLLFLKEPATFPILPVLLSHTGKRKDVF